MSGVLKQRVLSGTRVRSSSRRPHSFPLSLFSTEPLRRPLRNGVCVLASVATVVFGNNATDARCLTKETASLVAQAHTRQHRALCGVSRTFCICAVVSALLRIKRWPTNQRIWPPSSKRPSSSVRRFPATGGHVTADWMEWIVPKSSVRLLIPSRIKRRTIDAPMTYRFQCRRSRSTSYTAVSLHSVTAVLLPCLK